MDNSLNTNTNSDGNDTTTLALPGTLNEECDTETVDGQTTMTTASDGWNTTMNDGQTEIMTMREVMDVIGGDHTVVEEQPMMVIAEEEMSMMVDVDPLACPMSAYLSADEAVLSPSSGTPLKSVSVTPVTPRRDFLSAAEGTPDVPGCGSGIVWEPSDDRDLDVGPRRRVVGRKLVVVEDDGETQSSKPNTSADEDILTTASSSKARNKGVKRKSRRIEKDKGRKYEETIEEWSSEERKRKKEGKKRDHGKKDTPEELSDGECGEPKGVVGLVFEDMTSAVLGGAILEWINRIGEIRVKSRNFQGRLSGEMKKCAAKIKEATALLVARSESAGDPQFLRMRNTELMTQLRETENENIRLKEQLRRMSLGPSPPRRKRRVDKVEDEVDVCQTVPANLTTPKRSVVAKVPIREEFPPLP